MSHNEHGLPLNYKCFIYHKISLLIDWIWPFLLHVIVARKRARPNRVDAYKPRHGKSPHIWSVESILMMIMFPSRAYQIWSRGTAQDKINTTLAFEVKQYRPTQWNSPPVPLQAINIHTIKAIIYVIRLLSWGGPLHSWYYLSHIQCMYM